MVILETHVLKNDTNLINVVCLMGNCDFLSHFGDSTGMRTKRNATDIFCGHRITNLIGEFLH